MSTTTHDTATVRKWKRYLEYRPAEHWFTELPANWRPVPLKHTFRIINGATPQSSEPKYWDGDIPWATPDDLGNLVGDTLRETGRQITREGYENCGTTIAPPGSLVLSTRAPIGHLAISGTAMCTNQGCRSLVFKTAAEVRYFYYLLRACKPELQSLGRGSTFVEFSRDELASVALPVPPLAEQRAIAAFLDRETARIDALIGHKERLIVLLEEKRQAVISHAVTRGLDPNVPLKDSGVPWLGMVPSHWDLRRLKYISPEQSVGLVINPSTYVDEQGEIPFLFGGNVLPGGFSLEGVRRITVQSNKLISNSILRTGDLVTVRVGAPGVTAVIPRELDGCNCASIMIIRRSTRFNSDWLCYAMNSSIGKTNVELAQYGAAQEQFNISHAVDFLFPVPPFAEQTTIAKYLHRYSESVDRTVRRIRENIGLLQEQRTALISAAVTGQIDVRGEVSP